MSRVATSKRSSAQIMTVHIIRRPEDLEALSFAKPVFSESRLLHELVESKLVSPDAVREVLEYRRANGADLLDSIEKLGIVEQSQRPSLLAARLGIPMVHIESLAVDHALLTLIPVGMAIKHRVFPLGKVKGRLVVAVADPADKEAISAVTFAVGHPIEVVVASEEDISRLIDSHFLVLEEQSLISEIGDEAVLNHAPAHGDNQAGDVERRARERPIVRLVDAIVRRAIRMRASDINVRPLEQGAAIYYRIDGEMLWQRMLPPDLVAPIVCRMKIMSGMNIAEHRLPQDGHASLVEAGVAVDLRVSMIPTVNGESVVIRILNKEQAQIRLDQLGIAASDQPRLQRILEHSYGIFLVTGPTGSGKSTTLYAVINERMKNKPHIITVEDPVEYRIDDVEQIQIKPGIGYTFAEALRHILRHDPDEILVGEMRDYETAEIAIKAALTGHFVMSTLHTNDAASAVTRLQDMGLEPYLISSSVVGIMAQRLVRRICPECRCEDDSSDKLRQFFGVAAHERFYRGRGCSNCSNTGYRGRAMVGELMEITPAVRELVNRKAAAAEIRRVAVDEGMTPLTQNALQLARTAVTTLDEVFAVKLE